MKNGIEKDITMSHNASENAGKINFEQTYTKSRHWLLLGIG